MYLVVEDHFNHQLRDLRIAKDQHPEREEISPLPVLPDATTRPRYPPYFSKSIPTHKLHRVLERILLEYPQAIRFVTEEGLAVRDIQDPELLKQYLRDHHIRPRRWTTSNSFASQSREDEFRLHQEDITQSFHNWLSTDRTWTQPQSSNSQKPVVSWEDLPSSPRRTRQVQGQHEGGACGYTQPQTAPDNHSNSRQSDAVCVGYSPPRTRRMTSGSIDATRYARSLLRQTRTNHQRSRSSHHPKSKTPSPSIDEGRRNDHYNLRPKTTETQRSIDSEFVKMRKGIEALAQSRGDEEMTPPTTSQGQGQIGRASCRERV